MPSQLLELGMLKLMLRQNSAPAAAPSACTEATPATAAIATRAAVFTFPMPFRAP